MDTKEIYTAIRTTLSNVFSSVLFWFKRYRPWVFSGLTVLTILLVVWARFGFTFEVGQFFAAEPSQEGVLTVQCGATSNTLTWTQDTSANSNSIERGNTGAKNAGVSGCADYWCWLPSQGFNHQVPTANTPATYTDTQIDEGVCYEYRVKYQPQLPSNSVFCPVNCNNQSTPTPTPTLTPTPAPALLECAPASQTVAVDEDATVTAAGGVGITYEWSADEGQPISGQGAEFTTRYNQPGTYEVTLVDLGGAGDEEEQPSTTCRIVVEEEELVIPGELAMSARVRNFTDNGEYRASATGRPSQQFQIRITLDTGDTSIENVEVMTPLPDTLRYVTDSTTIDGSPTSVNTITTSGLSLGDVSGREELTFIVQAGASGQLPVGTLTSVVTATAAGDDAPSVDASVTVIITNASAIQPPAQVPTGPGDVTLLALMSSALVTLLYISYTHTSLYRSREVDSISQDGDHMDFKG